VKKLLFVLLVTTLTLNGCATNDPRTRNTGLAALACGGLGAIVGAFADGGKGMAIGAGTGALVCGAAAYAFADSFSESVVEQEAVWKNQVGAERDSIDEANVTVQGKAAREIKKETLTVSNVGMVSGRHLSPAARRLLSNSNSKLRKSHGTVHVKCPAGTPQKVMNEIRRTGATCEKTNQLTAYKVVFSKSAGRRHRA